MEQGEMTMDKEVFDGATLSVGDRVKCNVCGDQGTIMEIQWVSNSPLQYGVKFDSGPETIWVAPDEIQPAKKC